jgi:AraC-like DNA-binding protein
MLIPPTAPPNERVGVRQPHGVYVFAVAIVSTDSATAALIWLEETHRRYPADTDLSIAAMSIARDTVYLSAALRHAREHAALYRTDWQLRTLVINLEKASDTMRESPRDSGLVDGHNGVPHSRIRRFVDSDQYQSAIQGGDRLYSLLGRGTFRAELTSIEVGRLTLQRGREDLPRLAASGLGKNKAALIVWLGDGYLPVIRGVQIRRGELMYLPPGAHSHHRTFGPNEFVAMTLDASDLSRAAIELTGTEPAFPAAQVMRPPDHLMARVSSAIEAAISVGLTTPAIFTSPTAADALEQALLHPMIMCLLSGEAREERVPPARRAAIAKKFEEAVEANLDAPLLLRELRRIVGVPERTLHAICQEQLGISPKRFLDLRRLHLTRQALLRSDHHSATVTEVAMSHGFWELGRFAVAYKALFGESPSATLRRPL